MAKIPKIIHYCWFGGDEPEYVKHNIENWRKVCPDFTIKRWNGSNFDYGYSEYTKEASTLNDWAFVSDVARLVAIYSEGGIYLDTDIKLKRSLDAVLEDADNSNVDSFFALEYPGRVNTGLGFGATPKNNLLREILDMYQHQEFLNKQGTRRRITTVDLVSDFLHAYGLDLSGQRQVIGRNTGDSSLILPVTVFPNAAVLNSKEIDEEQIVGIHQNRASWKGKSHYGDRALQAKILRSQMALRLSVDKVLGFGTYQRLKRFIFKY